MRSLLSLVLLFAVAYLAVTAYAGYRVGKGIEGAKHASVVTRIGADLLGRTRVERIAIERGGIPPWVTRSPAFWAALRASE